MQLNILIGFAIVVATWIGGAPLYQIFSLKFLGVALLLFFVTSVLFRVFAWARLMGLAWLTFSVMVIAAYLSGGVFKYQFSDMGSQKMGANAPVLVERVVANDMFTGEVRVTNIGNALLESAYVRCTIRWDNGQLVDHDFKRGFISNDRMLPGMSKVFRVVNNYDFSDNNASRDSLECKLTEATFANSVPFANKLALTFGKNAYGAHAFVVTNNTDFAIKNVQFTCVAREDGRTHHVTSAYPAYNSKISDETIIAPGATAKFVDNEHVWNYTSCIISNAMRS